MRPFLITLMLLLPAGAGAQQLSARFTFVQQNLYCITLANSTDSDLIIARNPVYKYDTAYEHYQLYYYRYTGELKADIGAASYDQPITHYLRIPARQEQQFRGVWYLKLKAPAVWTIPVSYSYLEKADGLNDKQIRKQLSRSKPVLTFLKCRQQVLKPGGDTIRVRYR